MVLNFLKQSYSSNISKFYIASFFEAMWFAGPVWILYFLANGLNLEQIGILISVLFITQVIFEIPSSVWADRYSRKNIMIIEMIFWLIGQIFFILDASFGYYVLGMIFLGLSNAFASGTESAIIYDTLLNLGREKEYNQIKSKTQGAFFLGRLVISVGGVLAYTYDHKLPFLLSIITSLTTIFILFLVKEPKFHKSSGAHLGQIREGMKFLLANDKVWLIVLVFSLMSATADILYDYYQPVLKLTELPILYFTYVYIGVNIASFIGAMSYDKLAGKLSSGKILAFYLSSVFVASIAFAEGKLIFILPLILLVSFCFGSHNVYVTSLINEIVPSSHRSTTMSIQSLINRIMLAILIVAVGWLADSFSVFWAMIFNAVIVLFAFTGFLFVKFKTRTNNAIIFK